MVGKSSVPAIGVNVVATASFITGHNQGEGRDRIAEACERGGSTMFGSGISPGYVNQLSIVAAGICDRVDKITVNEAADTTFYDSPRPRSRWASASRSTTPTCRR